jgi:4-methyl-5(b-hydroxyethyl)-thiazole monophosphate biosynthesis
MKRACVLLADGFEETEAVAVIDVLRRAEIKVEVLGVEGKRVTGSHQLVLEADALLSDRKSEKFDLVVLPGGMPGAATLRDHWGVQKLLQAQHASGGLVAAICAAPIALAKAGVLDGKRATCFPGFEDQLGNARHETSAVVKDGNVITSRGVGTALVFALALVEALRDKPTAALLAERMLVAP